MRNKFTYIPLALFIIISVILSVTSYTEDNITPVTIEEKKVLEYNNASIGEELVYMRGENTESFKADSGRVISRIYTEPIFYQTDSDTMARIDTSVNAIDILEKEILYSSGWAAYGRIS